MGIPVPYIAETTAPDMNAWEYISEYTPQFGVVQAYNTNTQYFTDDLVNYNSNVYQLGTNIDVQYRAASLAPNLQYWSKIEEYIPEKYSPSLIYTNGVTYAYGAFVNYNGSVYICTDSDGFTAITDEPDTDIWVYVNEVQSIVQYQQGSLYTIYTKVYYSGFLYQLTYTTPYISNSAGIDTAFWELIPNFKNQNITEMTRIFKIIVNSRQSALIEFTTDEDMGYVKVGEQLGDTIQKDIKISGTDIASFE